MIKIVLLYASAVGSTPSLAQATPLMSPVAAAALIGTTPSAAATPRVVVPHIPHRAKVRTSRPNPARLPVDRANRAALLEPKASGYVNAVQVYPWTEGALYRLFAAPERISDIALQPGETLVSVAAGDTVRWIIGDTTSGAGADKRTHILIKPASVGLRTNLIIATDRRAYHLQLESTAATAMSAISWTYPQDALMALRGAQAVSVDNEPVDRDIAVATLNFSYTISGDKPSWRPVRAFDDGRQTFIAFPASIAVGEAPPLFIRGAKGEAELVNYRMRGSYYVVDRLFETAELRLGTKNQQIVRIARDAKGTRARHASDREAS